MAFKDFTELVEPLRLPYRGKTYEIPAPGWDVSARILGFLGDSDGESISDDELRDLLLGDVFEEMKADGCPPQFVSRAVLTALADLQAGRATAEIMWETGGLPKEIEKWVAANSAPETHTDAERTTPTRSGSSGTSTRKSSSAKRTSGRRSSTTSPSSSKTSKTSTV